jgi:hypothetical protein
MKKFQETERQFLPQEVNSILEAAARGSLTNDSLPETLSESQLREIARLSNISESALETAISQVTNNQISQPDLVNHFVQFWRKRGWINGLAVISLAIGLWIGIAIYPTIAELIVGSKPKLVGFERFFSEIMIFMLIFHLSSLVSWIVFNGLLGAIAFLTPARRR